MDIVKEIEEFNKWAIDKKLTPQTVLLWNTLVILAAKHNSNTITFPSSNMMQLLTRLSKSGIFRARTHLFELGLIVVTNENNCITYHLNLFTM